MTKQTPLRWPGPDGALAWLLVAALPVIWAPGFTDLLIMRQAVLGLGGGLVLVLWGLQHALRATPINPSQGVAGVVAGLVVLAGVSLTWAAVPSQGLAMVLTWLGALGILLAVAAPTRAPIGPQAWLGALMLGLLAGGGLNVMRLMGVEQLGSPRPYPSTEGWLILDVALMAAVVVPWAISQMAFGQGRERALGWVLVILASALVGLSRSLDAYLALGAGLALGVLILMVAKRGNLLSDLARGLAVALATTLLMSVVPLAEQAPLPGTVRDTNAEADKVMNGWVDPGLRERMAGPKTIRQQLPHHPENTSARLFLAATGLRGALAQPLSGHGAGQVKDGLEASLAVDSSYYRSRFAPVPALYTSHSTLLDLFVQLGIGGFLLWLALIILALRQAIVVLRPRDEDTSDRAHLRAGVVLSVVVGLVASLIAPVSMLPAALAVTMAMLGALFAFETTAPQRALSLPVRVVAALAALAATASLVVMQLPVLQSNYHRQWGNLYVLKVTAGNATRALEEFARAIELNPQDTWSHASRGALLSKMTGPEGVRFEEALEETRAALTWAPHDNVLLLQAADLARKTRQIDAARGYLQKAAELEPRNVDVRFAQAALHSTLNEGEEAVTVLRGILEADPDPMIRAKALTEMGRQLTILDRFDEARFHLDQAVDVARASRININIGAVIADLDQKIELRKKENLIGGDGHGHGHGHNHGHSPGLPGMKVNPPMPPPADLRRHIPPTKPKKGGHDHAGHDHAGPGHEGHGHEGHDHAGPGHEGHGHEGHDHAGPGHEGHGHEGHDHAGHDHAGPGHEGHGHEGHDHAGPGHEGHGHEGHGHEGHDHGAEPKATPQPSAPSAKP